MRWIMNIAGAILVLLGIAWTLQGFDVLLGSTMSGHIQYAVLGIIMFLVGIGLMLLANRSRRML